MIIGQITKANGTRRRGSLTPSRMSVKQVEPASFSSISSKD
jgi:hypothetical protein